jgi:hypothetical protein
VSDRVSIALDLVDKLELSGTPVRIFGGTAFTLGAYWDQVYGSSRPLRDIDFVTSRDDLDRVLAHISHLGGTVDHSSLLSNDSRLARIFYQGVKVDLYSDPLYLNQRIEIGTRLTLDRYTLAGADLLATKLQIEKRTNRDIQDVFAFLAVSFFSSSDDDGHVNVNRIVELCSGNWGFYFACARFLSAVEGFMSVVNLPADARIFAMKNILFIWSAIIHTQKGVWWKVRDRIGCRLKWYSDVDSDK